MKIIKNTTLFIISIFTTLFFIELILRQTEIGHYNLNNRVLFYTDPSLIVDMDGSVKYTANAKIRSVAIYGNQVEYDVVYRTNNLGFIDTAPYVNDQDKKKNIIFIGNSFTAGSGSSIPWISRVRNELQFPDVEIYNLGVTGTGVHHFYYLLKNFKRTIPFQEVNVMAISGDFFRGYWYPHTEDGGLWFCHNQSDDNCPDSKPPVIFMADQNESEDELLERANNIFYEKINNKQNSLKFHQEFRLYNLFREIYEFKFLIRKTKSIRPQFIIYRVNRYVKNKNYKDAIKKLLAIKNYFPKVKFRLFHIPEKGEVFAEKYLLSVKDDVEKIGIEYIPLLQICEWDTSMYYKHDSHLNEDGYHNLTKCMTNYIRKDN